MRLVSFLFIKSLLCVINRAVWGPTSQARFLLVDRTYIFRSRPGGHP
jgi:hypothetical protein